MQHEAKLFGDDVYRNENRHTCIYLGLEGHQTVIDGGSGKLIVTRIQKVRQM